MHVNTPELPLLFKQVQTRGRQSPNEDFDRFSSVYRFEKLFEFNFLNLIRVFAAWKFLSCTAIEVLHSYVILLDIYTGNRSASAPVYILSCFRLSFKLLILYTGENEEVIEENNWISIAFTEFSVNVSTAKSTPESLSWTFVCCDIF